MCRRTDRKVYSPMTSQVWVEDAACAAEEDGASFDKSLCEGKRLRGLNLILARTYDEAVSSLQSKSDRDARGVLQNLSSDLKKQNNALSAYMAQLWDMNSGLREMLKKSEDGQAAIHMHKAAELLVKVCRPSFSWGYFLSQNDRAQVLAYHSKSREYLCSTNPAVLR